MWLGFKFQDIIFSDSSSPHPPPAPTIQTDLGPPVHSTARRTEEIPPARFLPPAEPTVMGSPMVRKEEALPWLCFQACAWMECSLYNG